MTSAKNQRNSQQPVTRKEWTVDRWFAVGTLTMLCSGVAAVVLYGLQYFRASSLAVITTGFMIAGASLVVGGLLGFLFGIPRTQSQSDHIQESADSPHYSPNTNLEQISDWLTKILVGVGLTQLSGIRRALNDLAQFLSPALGGRQDSPAFAFAILMYFVTSGFVLGYLWTRILLPAQFQAADLSGLQMRIAKAERATEDVREKVKQQAEIDAKVFSMVAALLNPTPGSSVPSQEDLNEAVAEASPAIRVQIFNQAQLQRMQNWRDPADIPKMELTIPIFRALIAADKENRFDRNHAQLGYALKDKRIPDWAEAERELTEAIRIRGTSTAKGLIFYELNRAYCRIMQDPDFINGRKSRSESMGRILDDLRLSARAGLANILRGDENIQKFLSLNGFHTEDLGTSNDHIDET